MSGGGAIRRGDGARVGAHFWNCLTLFSGRNCQKVSWLVPEWYMYRQVLVHTWWLGVMCVCWCVIGTGAEGLVVGCVFQLELVGWSGLYPYFIGDVQYLGFVKYIWDFSGVCVSVYVCVSVLGQQRKTRPFFFQ